MKLKCHLFCVRRYFFCSIREEFNRKHGNATFFKKWYIDTLFKIHSHILDYQWKLDQFQCFCHLHRQMILDPSTGKVTLIVILNQTRFLWHVVHVEFHYEHLWTEIEKIVFNFPSYAGFAVTSNSKHLLRPFFKLLKDLLILCVYFLKQLQKTPVLFCRKVIFTVSQAFVKS